MRIHNAAYAESWAREDIAHFKRELVLKISVAIDLQHWERAEPLARIFSIMFSETLTAGSPESKEGEAT